MQTIVLMIGLPGSGKSTIAEKIINGEIEGFSNFSKSNTMILSSDKFREIFLGDEKDQTNNELVFKELKKSFISYLDQGYNIIVDATNLNMKSRRSYVELTRKYNVRKVAYVVNTPFDECVTRAENRTSRPVNKNIIFKMEKRFQCPQPFEGLEVVFHNKQFTEEDVRKSYALSFSYVEAVQNEMFENMCAHMNIPQDNPYHKYTINEHCRRTSQAFKDDENLWLAARLHDVGKIFTRTYDENGVAHYYGHDNVGAYYVCSHIPEIFFNQNKNDILFTIFLINYHMLPFSIKEEKTEKKYKELFGEEWYNKLLLLHKADKENC